MDSVSTVVAKWFAGERVRVESRRMLGVVLACSVLTLGLAWREWRSAVRPLVSAKPPAPLPPDEGDKRFGLPVGTRKRIFEELAAAEPHGRAEGQKGFPGVDLAWSAEDHRGAFERQKAAEVASRHRISLTQVYLILDEGIRERWVGPDGAPLTPTTVPLHPRRNYGW